MRIAEIHVYRKELPVVGGAYTMSTMTLTSVDATIIKLVADNGLHGWGEVVPLGPVYQPEHALGCRAALAEMAPALIGQHCLSPLLLRRRMDDLLNGQHYAKAGIDIAQMDLLGRLHGVRVCDLLGGCETEQVLAYCAIGIGPPEETARLARARADEGYRGIQIKAGGRDVAIDIEVVRKVWEALGGRARLTVDANRGMTAADAALLSLACRDIPFTLEQPCNTLDELIALRAHIAHPIKVDESLECLNDVLRAIAAGVCDRFGLKITRLGGLNAMTTIRAICEARSIPQTCEDSWGGDILAAAIVHLGATVRPHLLDGVWTAGEYVAEPYDPEGGIAVENGRITVPSGPGLGVNPAAERIGELLASYG